MVGQDISFDSISVTTMSSTSEVPVIVTTSAANSNNKHTLGAALDALECRVAKIGIVLEISPPQGSEDNDDASFAHVSTKVLLCSNLVNMAITQAITYGHATQGNVARTASISALIPGNIVLFYQPNRYRFFCPDRVLRDQAYQEKDLRVHPGADLNAPWETVRLLVVSGGRDGIFSFFSPFYQSFLQVDRDGKLGLSSSQPLHVNDRPRADEKFKVEGGNESVRMSSVKYKTAVRDSFGWKIYEIKCMQF